MIFIISKVWEVAIPVMHEAHHLFLSLDRLPLMGLTGLAVFIATISAVNIHDVRAETRLTLAIFIGGVVFGTGLGLLNLASVFDSFGGISRAQAALVR